MADSKGIADRLKDIQPFHVMKLLERARQLEDEGRDVIHMEIGEPDFPTPEPVIKAGMEALSAGYTHYLPSTGLPALKQGIADYYRREYATEINPDRIIITPGSSGALQLIMSVLINPGDEVLVTDPGYPCNRHFVRLSEAKPVAVPVDEEANYQINPELAALYWTDKTKAVMLASPSNPTGSMLSIEALRDMQEFLDARQGYLIVDEIYQGLVYSGKKLSALQIDHDNLFVINSFSKYFGMTGWRLGWLVVPERFVDPVDRLAQNIFLAAPTLAQYAALAAFSSETREILKTQTAELKKRRNFLVPALQKLGFKLNRVPEGAFYLYMDCSGLTTDSFRFCQELLEKSGVAITPGLDFGENHPEKFVRFSFANPIEKLQAAVDRIQQFLSAQNTV